MFLFFLFSRVGEVTLQRQRNIRRQKIYHRDIHHGPSETVYLLAALLNRRSSASLSRESQSFKSG